MKIATPHLPPRPEEKTLALLARDGELEDAWLHDEVAGAYAVSGPDLTGVLLEKVGLTGAHLSRATFRDVVARQTDFSTVSLDSASVVRAEFVSCRMTGVDFSQANLHDVVFRGCKLDFANFRRADLRRVHFIDCTLHETDFNNAVLTSVEFQSSVLEKTSFQQARCKMVDLRSSQLSEVRGWSSLKGATIDGLQLIAVAPYLAQELGVIVRD